MSAVPGSMLTGETTRISMEVFNVGQVSLNSLRLTSSLGPQLLLDKVEGIDSTTLTLVMHDVTMITGIVSVTPSHMIILPPSCHPSTTHPHLPLHCLPHPFLPAVSLLIAWSYYSPRDDWTQEWISKLTSSCRELLCRQWLATGKSHGMLYFIMSPPSYQQTLD